MNFRMIILLSFPQLRPDLSVSPMTTAESTSSVTPAPALTPAGLRAAVLMPSALHACMLPLVPVPLATLVTHVGHVTQVSTRPCLQDQITYGDFEIIAYK